MVKEEKVAIKIDGPFLISSKDQRPGYVHAFPYLWKIPNGRLFLSVNKERDIHDVERFLLTSNDFGKRWRETDNWPTARYPGWYPGPLGIIDNHNIFTSLCYSFESKKKDIWILPIWFSKNGGYSWGPMQLSKLQLPSLDFTLPNVKKSVDIYNPPVWWIKEHKSEIEQGFIKPRPPESLEGLFKTFGRKRGPGIEQVVRISDKCLLGLVGILYEQDNYGSVAAVESKDGGYSWKFLSVVARYLPEYAEKSIGDEDGFCEPSLVKLSKGELLVILRMGSFYPLYAVRSKNNGRTWSQPEKLSVHGVRPTVLLMKNGLLALATGRPDVTLNLSLDKGYSWKYQIKFLEYASGKISTSNTTMIEISPNKLLYIYDFFKRDRTGKDYWLKTHGYGKILGCFIEIKT